jgi:hypothetical protein
MGERRNYDGPRHSITGKNFGGSDLRHTVGSATGEEDHDTVPGGWEGTDDATSTAPSDIFPPKRMTGDDVDDGEMSTGRAFAGGIGGKDGGVVDIKGTPIEESRDWEHDPIEEPT